MSEFKCYQAAETTNVVLGDADLSGHAAAPDAVVVISRVVGNPRARALMRLCNAVLNDDGLGAQHELDAMQLTAPDWPTFGDRVEDGGLMGTIVRCEECSGSGQLHQPDEVPEPVAPTDV